MSGQTYPDPKIAAAAEKQMRTWAQTQEFQAQSPRAPAVRTLGGMVAPFITVSREAGTEGCEIARLVGAELGWEVLDRNLLDRMADRFHVPRLMLESVDETESNWVYDVLGSWMDRRIVPHEKYVSYLRRIVLTAARRGSCVFVGRGARFLLPTEKGLAVRLIAPKKCRIEQIMKGQGLTAIEARRWMEATDHNRYEFVRRFFHHDVSDPHLYDLVINTQRFGVQGAVEQIVAAVSRRSVQEHKHLPR